MIGTWIPEIRQARWADQLSEVSSARLRNIYEQLRNWLHDAYPHVNFNVPTVAELEHALPEAIRKTTTQMQTLYSTGGPVWRHALRRGADVTDWSARVVETALRPVVPRATDSFLARRSPLSTNEAIPVDWADSTFWGSEVHNRYTENGRDPPDWAERRGLVLRRDGGKCKNCGRPLDLGTCHIHHVVRRSHGGNHALTNLVALCPDCHTLMDGHAQMRAIRPYWVSAAGTIHLKSCQHAKRSRTVWDSLPKLQEKGYRPCKVCKPWRGHERKMATWQPRIKRELEAWLSDNLEF